MKCFWRFCIDSSVHLWIPRPSSSSFLDIKLHRMKIVSGKKFNFIYKIQFLLKIFQYFSQHRHEEISISHHFPLFLLILHCKDFLPSQSNFFQLQTFQKTSRVNVFILFTSKVSFFPTEKLFDKLPFCSEH